VFQLNNFLAVKWAVLPRHFFGSPGSKEYLSVGIFTSSSLIQTQSSPLAFLTCASNRTMATSNINKSVHLLLTLLLLTLASSVAFTAAPSHERVRKLQSQVKLHQTNMRSANDLVQPESNLQRFKSEVNLYERRSLVKSLICTALVAFSAVPSAHAVMSVDTKTTLAPITRLEAERRFQSGRESVQYLLDHYDEICEGGGDNVRRYLGTVGVTSGLFGIGKALKVLGEDVDDIVECK